MYHIPTNKASRARRRLILKGGFVLLVIIGLLWEYSQSQNMLLLIVVAMILIYAIRDVRTAIAEKGGSTRHDLHLAIYNARLAAQGRQPPSITSLDLVVGILQVDESPVTRVLHSKGITLPRVRDLIDAPGAAWRQPEQTEEEFSSVAKHAIAAAKTIAISHHHPAVGTEHLLLAITEVDHNIVQLFNLLGIGDEELGRCLLELLDGQPGTGSVL